MLQPEQARMSNVNPYRKSYFNTQPDYLFPAYRSTVKRAPLQPLVQIPQTLSEITGPLFGTRDVADTDWDLTAQHAGAPLGERMIVSGRVLDESARPVANALVELWQANAAGRYRHPVDNHDAPMDPNFTGFGRVVTDAHGRHAL
jgi:protocatechuate 3,4-dioxygenase beta subunit